MSNEELFMSGNPNAIFLDETRAKLARQRFSAGYKLVEGSALFWLGQTKPSIIGTSTVIRQQGIGKVMSNEAVQGGIEIDDLYVGIFCDLVVAISEPIDGKLKLTAAAGPENGTLSAPLLVAVDAKLSHNLTIVDQHQSAGLAKAMEIVISHGFDYDIEIRICGTAHKNGFKFTLDGDGLEDFTITPGCRVDVNDDEDNLRIYSIFNK
jgi:hypothetical protein